MSFNRDVHYLHDNGTKAESLLASDTDLFDKWTGHNVLRKAIQHYRKLNNVTYQTLADAVGVCRATVHNDLKSHSTNVSRLFQYLAVLDIDYSFSIIGKGDSWSLYT